MRSKNLARRDTVTVRRRRGIALRISTDRKLGWPLSAESKFERKPNPLRESDKNPKLNFLMLWHHQPDGRACLHIRSGMDLHGSKVNPPGYQGAYREDSDGLGYTLEYAIPWSLLNAGDDPPRAGDELAAMWLVHWSDEQGATWKGQLIDVMKQDEHGWNFDRAATWGKAIYHPKGNCQRNCSASATERTPPRQVNNLADCSAHTPDFC